MSQIEPTEYAYELAIIENQVRNDIKLWSTYPPPKQDAMLTIGFDNAVEKYAVLLGLFEEGSARYAD